MTRSWRRTLVAAPLCTIVLGMAGCSSPEGPTSGACVEETVFSGQTPVPASTYRVEPITTTRTGRLEVTVDWVSDASIIRAVLTQAPCSVDQFHDDRCNVIFDLFPPPKPLEASTYWLRAGTYDLIIGNFGPTGEIASSMVTLRSTGCSAPGEER